MKRGVVFCAVVGLLCGVITAKEPRAGLSFTREPVINPKMIEELVSGQSGREDADQVVAVDVRGSQDCSKFDVNDVKRHPDGNVGYEEISDEGNHHVFSYQYIGMTPSGVIVLYTFSCGDGSSSDHSLLFLVIEEDPGLVINDKNNTLTLTRPRTLLKKLGEMSLGDRWKGQLKVEGNKLFIGKDHGWFSEDRDDGEVVKRTNDWEKIVTIEYPDKRQSAGRPSPADK